MKIRPEHYQHIVHEMRSALNTIGTERLHAHIASVKESGKAKDISMRIRWDIAHAAKLAPWFCSTLYSYVNDSHIDTALRSAMAELGIEISSN